MSEGTENNNDIDISSVSNIVKFAQEGNPSKLKAEVGSVMGSKIMDRIETRREEISKDMFGK